MHGDHSVIRKGYGVFCANFSYNSVIQAALKWFELEMTVMAYM